MKIVKICSSQGSLGKNLGCETAPDHILNNLNEFYLNEDGNPLNFQIKSIEIIKNNIEKTNENIELASGDIFIGGDHSITYPLFKGFAKNFKNPGMIVFDAHPDMVNNFKPPSHEDFLKVLIENNLLKPENLILVGIRNWHKNEYDFIKEKKIKFFKAKQIFNNTENICDNIMELSRNFDGLYLSIDIDAIDPSHAPGTGYIEPAGLSSRDLIYFIQRIKLLKNLKRVDIVEVNPKKDINNLTTKLAAKIIAELI